MFSFGNKNAVRSCGWKQDAKPSKTPTAHHKRAFDRHAKDNLGMYASRRAQVVSDPELSGGRTLGDQWSRECGDRLNIAGGYALLGERASETDLQSATTTRVSGKDDGTDGVPCFRRLAS